MMQKKEKVWLMVSCKVGMNNNKSKENKVNAILFIMVYSIFNALTFISSSPKNPVRNYFSDL